MNSHGGLPVAPPLPPWHPPKDNTRIWVIIGIVLGLGLLVPVTFTIMFMRVYGGHDRIELIDKPEIVEALAPTCHRVGSAATALRLEGTAGARAEALMDFSSVAHRIPTAVDGFSKEDLDSDIPTADWAADWTTLLAEIDEYAEDLSSGRAASFEMPSTPDGFSIVGRMNLASPSRGCNVPRAIVLLDDDPPRLP